MPTSDVLWILAIAAVVAATSMAVTTALVLYAVWRTVRAVGRLEAAVTDLLEQAAEGLDRAHGVAREAGRVLTWLARALRPVAAAAAARRGPRWLRRWLWLAGALAALWGWRDLRAPAPAGGGAARSRAASGTPTARSRGPRPGT